jgi:hypothetical protein
LRSAGQVVGIVDFRSHVNLGAHFLVDHAMFWQGEAKVTQL